MSKVHSKRASNIFGICGVMVAFSLLTIVAMVDSTSGSRAIGTEHRWQSICKKGFFYIQPSIQYRLFVTARKCLILNKFLMETCKKVLYFCVSVLHYTEYLQSKIQDRFRSTIQKISVQHSMQCKIQAQLLSKEHLIPTLVSTRILGLA